MTTKPYRVMMTWRQNVAVATERRRQQPATSIRDPRRDRDRMGRKRSGRPSHRSRPLWQRRDGHQRTFARRMGQRGLQQHGRNANHFAQLATANFLSHPTLSFQRLSRGCEKEYPFLWVIWFAPAT